MRRHVANTNEIYRQRRTASALAGITVTCVRLAALFVVLLSSLTVRAQTGSVEEVNLRRLELAVAAIGEGRLPQAEALLNSVLAAAPRDADALNLLGVVRAQQRRTAEAERLFRRALAVVPAHVGAQANLGELLLTTNRTQEALQVLVAAHRLAPDRADVNLKLATLYAGRGEHERALGHLRLVPRGVAGADYFPLLVESLLKLKRVDEAKRLAREFKEAGVVDAEARAEVALLLARGGVG